MQVHTMIRSLLLLAAALATAQPAFAKPRSGHGGPPPASACSRGTSYADGCIDAPCPGSPQNSTLFSGEAIRPPWNVTGVDFHVGLCPSDVLVDETTATYPANCGATVDTTDHIVRFRLTSGNPICVVTLRDFSLHNGYGIYIEGLTNGGHCGTLNITHSKFLVGSNQIPPFHEENDGCVSGTISDNDIDGGATGGGTADPLMATPVSATLSWSILRNNISRMYSHFTVNSTPDVVKWNYSQDQMYVQTAHSDAWHFNLGAGAGVSESGLTISFNTEYQSVAVAGLPGQANSLLGFIAPDDFSTGSAVMSNVSIDHNVAKAVGSTGHLVAGGATTGAGVGYYLYLTSGGASFNNVTEVQNYVDTAGQAFGSCNISGTFTGTLNFSGNMRMNTGAADTACNTHP